jgi:transcriptional regulator with XRE-family HTH domain
MSADLHRRALGRALQIVGGKDKLAVYLGTDKERLTRWLNGKGRPPVQVLQCVAALLRYTMLERATRKTAAKSRRRRR